MPLVRRPSAAAAAISAAVAASDEKARVPMMGLSGFVFTSASGAKSMLKPYSFKYAPMVCPMAQASAGSPDAPTAAALSYCGRSKAGWLARRATAPPSSSTAMKSGVRLAACKSALNCASCSGSVMFLPNWQMPPTG